MYNRKEEEAHREVQLQHQSIPASTKHVFVSMNGGNLLLSKKCCTNIHEMLYIKKSKYVLVHHKNILRKYDLTFPYSS